MKQTTNAGKNGGVGVDDSDGNDRPINDGEGEDKDAKPEGGGDRWPQFVARCDIPYTVLQS